MIAELAHAPDLLPQDDSRDADANWPSRFCRQASGREYWLTTPCKRWPMPRGTPTRLGSRRTESRSHLGFLPRPRIRA